MDLASIADNGVAGARRARPSVPARVLLAVVLLFAALACTPRPGAAGAATPDAGLDRRWQHAGDTAGPGEWSGADGTSSVALPDGRIAWFFSDTFLGPVNADGSKQAAVPSAHNSLVVQDGDRLTTLASGTPVRPPLGVPGWYWVGAGALEHGELVEFYHRFTGSGGWQFAEQSTAIATFALPGLGLKSIRELPPVGVAPGRSPVMWGSALLETDAWTYVYGYRAHLDQPGNPKRLYVARVPRGRLLDLAAWQYDSEPGWSSDPMRAAEMPSPVDAGFGVLDLGGRYALVTRRPSGAFTDDALVAYLAKAPTGPFAAADSAVLYRAPEVAAGRYVYEARVHPELGDENTVIVSYNVNSDSVPADCRLPPVSRDASVYRPRFVRVPLTAFRAGYHPPVSGPSSPVTTARPPSNGGYC